MTLSSGVYLFRPIRDLKIFYYPYSTCIMSLRDSSFRNSITVENYAKLRIIKSPLGTR